MSFYIFTDIVKADKLLHKYLQNKNSIFYRYFVYQGITVKILIEDYLEAFKLIDLSMSIGMTPLYEGHIQNNLAVLKSKIIDKMAAEVSKLLYLY